MSNVLQEKQIFEKWMDQYYPNFLLTKTVEGKYKSAGTRGMWDGWMLKSSQVMVGKYKHLK